MSYKNKDYYKIMGISRDATLKQVKDAFKRLSKVYNPGKNANVAGIMEKYHEIQEAYEVLSDSSLRDQYDEELSELESMEKEQTFIDVSQFKHFVFDPENFDWLDDFFTPAYLPPYQMDENLDVLLSQKEARHGAQLSVDLPSYFGVGFGFNFSPRRRFNLRTPAGVKTGEVKDIYVQEMDFWLRVKFTVY